MATNKDAIVPVIGVVARMMASSIASANARSQVLSALAGLAKHSGTTALYGAGSRSRVGSRCNKRITMAARLTQRLA
ncbi:hypothetical protein HaLaN_02683 [Haematococcus lacustris]|uniref:Uncharacterized protein n=1 Tax=Haematococcus lacustris TaxID=44745 RepID=A0A699YCS1_HAELA|nr:hypothetical protein HaLaN_02683 [Haematococcus lacustris]